MRFQPGTQLTPQTVETSRLYSRVLFPCLIALVLIAPTLLLLTAWMQNQEAATQFHDVNQSGSLRYRSLWVYGAGQQGEDVREQIAAMGRIRDDLRRRYPADIAITDTPWLAFTGDQHRAGRVSWSSADAMRQAANRLTQAIEVQAYRQQARATNLMLVGLVSLSSAFGVTLLLLYRLRHSEEHQKRLTTVLDSTTDLIGISDRHHHVLYLNHAFRRFLGLGRDEDISHIRIAGHIAPASYELLKTQGFPISQRDGFWQGETLFLAAGGQEIPMSQLVLTHTATDGSVQHLSTIARDVTAQKQTEEALRLEQARFAAIAAAQSDILASALEPQALMGLIAQKAMELTPATGAVIALIEADESVEAGEIRSEVLICRAACGSQIHSLGLRLALEGSLSGLCAQTGDLQICDEAETDPRADAAACRDKGVVSMLMFPLRHENAVIGVLNVLSPDRAAFSERDGQTLQLIAGFVGVALSRSREFEVRRALLEERTESLTKLQESQSLFFSSINAMHEGFAVQDWDGRVLMCNASAERMLGISASDYVGSIVTSYGWQFFREDGTDFPRDQHPTHVALRTGKAQPETVFGILRPDAPMQWLSLQAAPLFHTGDVRPYAAVQTFADITARKAAEDELRLTEARLRTVVENAPLVLTSLDAQGVYTSQEGRGLASMGMIAGQFVGRSIFEVFADQKAITEPLQQALNGELIDFASDFQGIHWSSQCVPLFDEQNMVQGLIVVSYDVTARQQAEDQLRRSEDRLRRLHDLTTARTLSGAQKMTALLALGCEFFDLDIGVITQIAGTRYTILHSVSPGGSVPAGLTCATKDTFCAEVARTDQPLALTHIGESEWRDLPAYAVFGLEAYLGVPLWVGDQLFGTLCFSSPSPHTQPFSEADLEILRLMTQWAGSEMAREEVRRQIEAYNVVLKFQKEELEKANQELESLATTDGLTEIKNHRAFQERLAEEALRAQRYGTPLSLILLDVDRFKQYNDTYGHPEGDRVLQAVAELLQANARETDLAARYGGEEFVVLLPQTDTSGAWIIAERIRRAIENYPWPHRLVTASLGLAALTPEMQNSSDLTAAADKALYAAKTAGRNRVAAAGQSAGISVLSPS